MKLSIKQCGNKEWEDEELHFFYSLRNGVIYWIAIQYKTKMFLIISYQGISNWLKQFYWKLKQEI